MKKHIRIKGGEILENFFYFNMEKEEKKSTAPWWQPGLLLFSKLSGWVVVPIVVALFVGRWLDEKYGTEPWLFLLSVAVAFAFSSYGIIHDSIKEIKKIEEEVKKNKGEENKDLKE